MEYVSLGRTGTQVSKICLGTMTFGDRTSEEESMDMVDRAIDAGVNFIDTANVYSRGISEEITGKALKRNGKRDQIVLATKVYWPMDKEDPNMRGNHRRHVMEQCEASLKRLQTDYVDLYQIHRPMSSIPIDETLRALDDLVRQGKVRYIGTSTFAAWQLVESLWASKEYGLNRFVTEQPPYHLLDRRAERELIPMARTYGIAILPWSPLAGGFLTGKYKRDQDPPEDGRMKKNAPNYSSAAYDVVDLLAEMAGEKGCSISQLALAWCAQQPGVTSPIIGPRTMEQLEDNLGAAEITLSEDDEMRINKVTKRGRAIVSYYDGDFGPHQHRW